MNINNKILCTILASIFFNCLSASEIDTFIDQVRLVKTNEIYDSLHPDSIKMMNSSLTHVRNQLKAGKNLNYTLMNIGLNKMLFKDDDKMAFELIWTYCHAADKYMALNKKNILSKSENDKYKVYVFQNVTNWSPYNEAIPYVIMFKRDGDVYKLLLPPLVAEKLRALPRNKK